MQSPRIVCVVASFLVAASVLLAQVPQNSGLAFAHAVSYDAGGQATYAVAVADLNGDGYPDIVVANQCAIGGCSNGSVGVLLGNGDGTFQPPVVYQSGGRIATGLAVGDVNGDGKIDLIVANYWPTGAGDGGTLGVLLGNGDGTFQPAVTYQSGGVTGFGVAIADVNGDGKLDLVATSECNKKKPCKYGVVGVLIGNGDGTFQPAVTYRSGGDDALGVVVADVNGDGKPDIVTANFVSWGAKSKHASVGVLLNNGDGTFQPAVSYDSGGAFSLSVAVADFNGDGVPDIVVANLNPKGQNGESQGVLGVLIGNGDGTFQRVVTYQPGGDAAYWLSAADVNGDGKIDVVVGELGGVGVLLGNGNGTLQPGVTFDSGLPTATGVAIADVNGDGKPDLVIANDSYSSSVNVMLNESTNIPITSLPPSQ